MLDYVVKGNEVWDGVKFAGFEDGRWEHKPRTTEATFLEGGKS